MPRLPSWHRYPGSYVLVLSVIMITLFVIEQINGRFWSNDFRVYYGAGASLLSGEPLYGVAHGLGTGFFKYAPVLALFYAPFSLLPYGLAASIQYGLIAFVFIDGTIRIDRFIRDQFMYGKAANYWPLCITALVGIVHLHRELHLGNINMFLVWILIVALNKLNVGKTNWGATMLGIAILAKPHFVVLLPLLLVFGRTQVLGVSLITILVGLVLPALYVGFGKNITLHGDWLTAMAEHNSALIYVQGDDLRAVNTVYSFFHRSVVHYFTQPSNTEAYILLAGIAGIFGGVVLWLKSKFSNTEKLFNFSFLTLIALVPSITLTDTEHFLFALPLIAFLVHHLLPKSDPAWLVWISVPLLFAYGGNWEDALGPLSEHMIHYGVLGIGSFGLLLLCGYLFLRSNLQRSTFSNN